MYLNLEFSDLNMEPDLVKKLKIGIPSAFDGLFELYATKVYRFAFSFLKSREDSEGVVQDTFLKIWEKRQTIDLNQSFKSWLFTIAYNNVMTKFREKLKEKKYREYILTSASEHYDQEQVLLSDDLLDQVLKIVDKLPQRRKQIFLLRKEKNLTYKAISEKLGISLKTVENNINQSIKFIKSHIGTDVLHILLFSFLFT